MDTGGCEAHRDALRGCSLRPAARRSAPGSRRCELRVLLSPRVALGARAYAQCPSTLLLPVPSPSWGPMGCCHRARLREATRCPHPRLGRGRLLAGRCSWEVGDAGGTRGAGADCELGARQWDRERVNGMGAAGEGLLCAPASGQGLPIKRRRLSRSAGG